MSEWAISARKISATPSCPLDPRPAPPGRVRCLWTDFRQEESFKANPFLTIGNNHYVLSHEGLPWLPWLAVCFGCVVVSCVAHSRLKGRREGKEKQTKATNNETKPASPARNTQYTIRIRLRESWLIEIRNYIVPVAFFSFQRTIDFGRFDSQQSRVCGTLCTPAQSFCGRELINSCRTSKSIALVCVCGYTNDGIDFRGKALQSSMCSKCRRQNEGKK